LSFRACTSDCSLHQNSGSDMGEGIPLIFLGTATDFYSADSWNPGIRCWHNETVTICDMVEPIRTIFQTLFARRFRSFPFMVAEA
jgi:hypothetical protein